SDGGDDAVRDRDPAFFDEPVSLLKDDEEWLATTTHLEVTGPHQRVVGNAEQHPDNERQHICGRTGDI
ncbi:hypothetical protein PJN93_29495, partial [Mycobacterium kansasii]